MTTRQLNAMQQLLNAANEFARAFPNDPDIMANLRRLTKAMTEWMRDGQNSIDTPN